MYGNWGNFTYTSVAELKQKAAKAIAKLPDATPALPHPNKRSICLTWWGQAWCHNLESYADFAYRLERGRRYFRAGTVIDLKTHNNNITAKVQGSDRNPYNITITIDKPPKKDIAAITKLSARRIDNIDALLKGNFPEDLQELFTQKKPGLFPTPKEIHFKCDCPDWAGLCKHVAAVLYGIGVRIDNDPTEMFRLRGIDIDNFISGVVDDKVAEMLEHVDVQSNRIIQNADIAAIFGING